MKRQWVVFGLMLAATSPALDAAWGRAPGDSTRWATLYAGGPTALSPPYPRYTTDELVRYLAVVDSSGRPVTWLTGGAIMLELFSASHHLFVPFIPGKLADGRDWQAYVDSLVDPTGPVARLDSAVARVTSVLGPPAGPYRLAVMIPYPNVVTDTMRYNNKLYHMGVPTERSGLVTAYVNDVLHRFRPPRFTHLTLTGFLWLRESVYTGDSAVLIASASVIHAAGLEFVWVPYYHPAAAEWRRWGFDRAWLQPNFFFHPEVPAVRIDSAFELARRAGMGIEIEFDRRLFTSPSFEDRLDPYLSRLFAAPDLRSGSIVLFDGAGGLLDLSGSREPWPRALYTRLTQALR